MDLSRSLLLFSCASFAASYICRGYADQQAKSELFTTDNITPPTLDPNLLEENKTLDNPAKNEILEIFFKNNAKDQVGYYVEFFVADIEVMTKLAKLYSHDSDKMLRHITAIVLPELNKKIKEADDAVFADDSVVLSQTPKRQLQVLTANKARELYCETMKEEIKRVIERYLELSKQNLANDMIAFVMSNDNKYGAIYSKFENAARKNYARAAEESKKEFLGVTSVQKKKLK